MRKPKKNSRDPSECIALWCAWARVELEMPRDEFDRFTPAEFFAVVDVWENRQRRLRLQDARLRYTIAASSGASTTDGTPLTVGYFLTDEPGVARKKTKRKRHTAEQLEQQFINALPKEWRP